MSTPTEIPSSLTVSIRFEFAYSLEQLAEYYQVNPEVILANPAYVNLMIERDVQFIVAPSGLSRDYYTALVLGTKDLVVISPTREVTDD